MDIMVELFKNGESVENIAKRMGVRKATVYARLSRHGLTNVRGGARRISEQEERDIVEKYKNGIALRKIAEEFEMSTTRVLRILRDYGVQKRGHVKKEFDIDRARRLYVQGMSMTEIGKLFGISQQLVSRKLKGLVNVRKTKVQCDESFFDEIDTEEKAYWLGFLIADGNIGVDNGIRIELERKDAVHLLKFLRAIQYEGNVAFRERDGVETAYIQVKSVRIANALRKLGLHTSTKSFDAKPVEVDGDLKRHFWRGLVDGDGGVYKYERGLQIKLVGTKAICEGFKKYVESLGCATNAQVGVYKGLYHFSVESKEVVKIVGNLYEKSTIYLERKYNKAIEILYGQKKDGLMKISSHKAELFLQTYHYLKTLPIACDVYGYYEDGVLLGVMAFGSPASQALYKVYGKNVVELRRFALAVNKKNLASKILATGIRELKKSKKGWTLVSYADAAQGHSGVIYKAVGMHEDGEVKKQLIGKVGDRILSGVHLQKYIEKNGIESIEFGESEGKFRYSMVL